MQTERQTGFNFWRETLKGARYVLAPMVDQSELAWRLLTRRHGTQLCYTPMYHAGVFVRDAHYRREALQSCNCKEDRPLIVQFCANDPQMLLKAAKYAEPHCEAVDLNLGCPQSVARRGHYGAFLQEEWDLLHEMVSLCAKELAVPITCKIRVFDDIDKTVRYAQMLERAGCQLLTVHGRTIVQKGVDTSLASWDHITAVRKNVNIPVFANGNIQYLSDFHRCQQETGVQGVMSAEGLLHNPALFTGQELPVWDIAIQYLDLVQEYPCPVSFVRGHLFKLFHHSLQKFKELREVLSVCKTLEDIRKLTNSLREACQPDVEKYKADPASLDCVLPLPHWICQPYVRPSSGQPAEDKSEKEATLKRSLQNVLNGETPALSKNKLKKLRRFPSKTFEAKADKFKKCPCDKPRGLKCVFEMCKACCRQQARLEKKDCAGHRYIMKKRTEEATGPASAENDVTKETEDTVKTESTPEIQSTKQTVPETECATRIGCVEESKCTTENKCSSEKSTSEPLTSKTSAEQT